ncbi:MAG: FecR domain-containing protein [Steroidobacteraceae bacterium]
MNVIPLRLSGAEDSAAAWLAIMDRGELSYEQRQQLHAWLEENARHADAFLRLARLWGQMDALQVLAQQKSAPKAESRIVGRRLALGAAAGAIVCVAALLAPGPSTWFAQDSQAPTERVYETDVGEQSHARLDDGSVIALNTRSKLRVRYQETERSIDLISGEANFEVAKNPQVPFVVYAGNGAVRAVGTAFNVRVRDGNSVDVTVAEGTVQVTAGTAATKHSSSERTESALKQLTLKRGGVANYGDAIQTYGYVTPEKLAQNLAWKNGKWIFAGESLAMVVAEANRYSSTPIEIADPAIGGVRVGGYFDVGDVNALLHALEVGFGIQVRRGQDAIQLSAASPSPPVS